MEIDTNTSLIILAIIIALFYFMSKRKTENEPYCPLCTS